MFGRSGECLYGVWKVSERSLEGVWKVIGSFLDQLEIQSIEYSHLGFYYDQNENFYLELECGPAQSYLFFHFFLIVTIKYY